MPGQNDNKSSNLWLGFAFGAIAATAVAFLLGTKKGRQTLKKLLELSENLEENALTIAEEIEETILDNAQKLPEAKQNKPILGTLLDKMKALRN
ncbi:YtxH domain-containing protein [Candidatus Roizmanbacteria bacterium]|nr:YtxH domain-containing protein [Candidatus Roizmanbacteria bacterium]